MIRAFNKKTRLIVFLFMILCIEQQSIKFIVLPIMYFGLFSLGLSTGCLILLTCALESSCLAFTTSAKGFVKFFLSSLFL